MMAFPAQTRLLLLALLLAGGGVGWMLSHDGTAGSAGQPLVVGGGLAPAPQADTLGVAPQRHEPLPAAGERVPDGREPEGQAAQAWERLVVEVVDARTLTSIEGAAVHVRSTGELEWSAVTNAAGRAEVTWPGGHDLRGLGVGHPEYRDVTHPPIAQEQLTALGEGALRVALHPSGALGGYVSPPRAGVRLALYGYSASLYKRRATAVLETDEEGRFEFLDLDPDEYALVVMDDEEALTFRAGIHVRAGEREEFTLELPPLCALRVSVLERESRTPIQGATVRARPELQEVADKLERHAGRELSTSELGVARWEEFAPGEVDVEVETAWGDVYSTRVWLEPHREAEVEVALARPGRLSGSVEGRVTEGVRIELLHEEALEGERDRDQRGQRDPIEVVLTGSDGAFEFTRVPALSRIVLVALPPGGATPTVRRGLKLKPGEVRADLLLALDDVPALGGVVTSSDGAAVAGAELDLDVKNQVWVAAGAVATGLDGAFRMPASGGRLRLTVRAPGYRTRVLELQPASGERAGVEIELESAGTLAGWVVDETGWAIPGARVLGRFGARKRGARSGDWKAGASADDYGAFELEDLRYGEWSLEASAVGWLAAGPEQRRWVVPGTLDARVVLRRDPLAASAAVFGFVHGPDGEPVPGLELRGLAGGCSVHLWGTRFEVRGLRPGELSLVATAPGFEPHAFEPLQLSPEAFVELPPVELHRAARVEVNVVDGQGRPVRGAKVWLDPGKDARRKGSPLPRRIPLAERAGAYRSSEVPRARWQLRITRTGFQPYKKWVLVDRRRFEARVQLRPTPRRAEAAAKGRKGG